MLHHAMAILGHRGRRAVSILGFPVDVKVLSHSDILLLLGLPLFGERLLLRFSRGVR